MEPVWLTWVRELQAIAQTGLTYSKDPYDRERYGAIRRLAAEIAAYATGSEALVIDQLFAAETGHATPKVDVRGALFQHETILLVRERSEGLWSLPGGWADVGEAPSRAVARELREESGYASKVTKLAMLYDRDHHGHPPHPFHIYKLFFICDLLGGEPVHSLEVDDVGFFALDHLPPLSLSRVTVAEIRRLFDHHQHPEWPTDFD
jgi:ADP-ribose pyrophosphatase YjhB (NUDIX family)